MMFHQMRREDAGAVLIIVLIFLTFFSILVVSLLGLSGTGLKEVGTVHIQRSGVSTSEGAVRAAIKHGFSNFQSNHAAIVGNANSWSWCTNPAFSLPGNSVTAQVRCTVVGSTVSGDSAPRPPWGIQTLSGGHITQNRKGASSVSGGVWAAGKLSVAGNGIMNVEGDVRAGSGTCPRVNATGTKSCPFATAPSDPGYGPVLASAPTAAASVPATCATQVVEFDAPAGGMVFSDAAALNKLTDGKGADGCSGKVLWFRPGVYRFRFNNSGTHAWQIRDGKMAVVGGAAVGGWNSNPSIRPSIPGACVDTPATWASSGVQFVFDGDSRLEVSNGSLELCGRSGGLGNQRIAIYGPAATANGYERQTSVILKGTDKGSVSVHGSLYAPTGSVQLHDQTLYTPVIDRGILAKSVSLRTPRFAGPAVRLPPPSQEAEVTVSLFSRVGGKDWIHAQVTYARRFGVFSATIDQWDVLR